MTWPVLPIRRVFRVLNGGTPTSEEVNWAGDVPWATPVDLSAAAGRAIKTTNRNLTRLGAATGSAIAPAGSLIISTRAPIGYVAQASVDMAFNQGCRALAPSRHVDQRFFAYQLSVLTSELQSRGQGSTFSEISSDLLAELPLHVPSVEEQRRIADFLDAETAQIRAITDLRRLQLGALAERVDAAISEVLFPGILTSTGRSARWPWLPRATRSNLVRLGHICQLQTGVTVDGARPVSGDSVTRPYLRVANVQAGYLELNQVAEITLPELIARRSTLRPGDVLMTEGGDLDKLGRGTVWAGEVPGCLHQNHIFALRPDRSKLDSHYLAYMTQTLHGRAYFESTGVRTTNLASTNSSKIMGFPLPLPSLREQQELVSEVRTELTAIRRLQEALAIQLGLLSERRQALITSAVTGQVDVSTARGVAS